MPVTFRWVKGHQGNEANEAADRLAVLARRNANSASPTRLAQECSGASGTSSSPLSAQRL